MKPFPLSSTSLPAAIWALGFTSLFMDVSSEMIHALLPIYITGTLGAGALALGMIEGVAEATALIVKIFSGVISDMTGKRKTLALLGYGMAALTKPLFPLATSLSLIVTARFVDRIGKGIRGAPRDALVADIAPKERLGEAYGLRQALDTVGAFLGPLIAVVVMLASVSDIRLVFWIAVIPALLSVLCLALFVPEPQDKHEINDTKSLNINSISSFSFQFWIILGLGAALSAARISDAFLILRVTGYGLPTPLAPLILVAMNIIYALFAWPVGRWADRWPRQRLLAAGLVVLIVGDIVLATGSTFLFGGIGMVLWGLHLALTQGILAAMIAEAAPAPLRGTAFGLYNLASGLAMLVGNVAAGLLWDRYGPATAFIGSGALAAASFLFLPWTSRSRTVDPETGTPSSSRDAIARSRQ